jgi:hypothetical protein
MQKQMNKLKMKKCEDVKWILKNYFNKLKKFIFNIIPSAS